MNKTLLKKYLKMVIDESKLARVPNQLISPNEENGQEEESEEAHDVKEFSGVGAIAGYSAPLGMSPDALGRKKNSSKK